MPKMQIKGLTLHRPWGYAVAILDKRIENRSWNCPLQIGTFIAIHNGQKWDKEGELFIRHQNASELFDHPGEDNCEAGAIVAIAQFDGNTTEDDSPWFCGPVGWKLKNVVAISPIRGIKGQQGLWSLSDELLIMVRKRWCDRVSNKL
ncbi:MAG: hypothetical protein ACRCYP_03610 [Alphaproteobacteria bacterium]